MKLLKLRRNVVKLSLYRHFTNTLIFAVIGTWRPAFCRARRRFSPFETQLSLSFSLCHFHRLGHQDHHSVRVPGREYQRLHSASMKSEGEPEHEAVKPSVPESVGKELRCLSTGLEGALDQRRLLALPVLHHPAGHHVPVAAVRQQPEVPSSSFLLLSPFLCSVADPPVCPGQVRLQPPGGRRQRGRGEGAHDERSFRSEPVFVRLLFRGCGSDCVCAQRG